MKTAYYLVVLLLIVFYEASAYSLTPDEMLLLRRSGVPEEKILERQKKELKESKELEESRRINLTDWNNDGKKDIISGSDNGYIYVYLNRGTNQQPVFDKPIEIRFNISLSEAAKVPARLVMGFIFGASAAVGSYDNLGKYSDPYIVDWNNDGKNDFVIGQGTGEISVFINNGTIERPLFASEIKLNKGELDVGNDSSPTMVDWNGDGKKDLVVGNRRGKIFVFLNSGEDYAPVFSSEGTETNIEVAGNATPSIADWNNDGKFDVVCGSSDGKVYIFINEGDSKNPKFSKAQMLLVDNKELKLPSRTSVIPLDWDDDGKTDLLISNKEIVEKDPGGRDNIIPLGIYLLLNTGTKEKPEFKELKPVKGKFRDDTAL